MHLGRPAHHTLALTLKAASREKKKETPEDDHEKLKIYKRADWKPEVGHKKLRVTSNRGPMDKKALRERHI